VNVPVIASGGAGELDHFAEVVIEADADAVLAASVFHYGELTVRQVKEAMAAAGVPVRL
jgi:cyclase